MVPAVVGALRPVSCGWIRPGRGSRCGRGRQAFSSPVLLSFPLLPLSVLTLSVLALSILTLSFVFQLALSVPLTLSLLLLLLLPDSFPLPGPLSFLLSLSLPIPAGIPTGSPGLVDGLVAQRSHGGGARGGAGRGKWSVGAPGLAPGAIQLLDTVAIVVGQLAVHLVVLVPWKHDRIGHRGVAQSQRVTQFVQGHVQKIGSCNGSDTECNINTLTTLMAGMHSGV